MEWVSIPVDRKIYSQNPERCRNQTRFVEIQTGPQAAALLLILIFYGSGQANLHFQMIGPGMAASS